MTKPIKPYSRFDFDLARAVLEQLIEVFDSLDIGPLDETLINEVDRDPGVYQLFLTNRVQYVGKADDNLRKRLLEHLATFKSRKNVKISEIGFKGVTVHRNWTPLTHEEALIQHYKGAGLCEWNTKGLGNHDPGRNRENTITNAFDQDYPIDEEFIPTGIDPKLWNARELLLALKSGVPYVFRFETEEPKGRWRAGSAKYNTLSISVPRAGMTMKELLRVVINSLESGWQATFFPGHVVLYEENRTYTHATLVLRKP